METPIDEVRIKQWIKEALVEVVEERKGVLYELPTEVMEDGAMVHAIQEGETTRPVHKQEVLALLDEST